MVIQKRLRGHNARKEANRQRNRMKDRIEQEYGDFNRDIKFNSDFNLQRYVKEKRKLRKQNALGSNSAMDDIDEIIGESSSNLGDKFVQSAQSIQM